MVLWYFLVCLSSFSWFESWESLLLTDLVKISLFLLKQCSFVKWLAKFQLFNFQGSFVVWLIALCIFFLGGKPFIAIPLFLGKTGTQKKATHVFFSLTILQTSFPPNKTSLYQWLTLRFCLDSIRMWRNEVFIVGIRTISWRFEEVGSWNSDPFTLLVQGHIRGLPRVTRGLSYTMEDPETFTSCGIFHVLHVTVVDGCFFNHQLMDEFSLRAV